MNAYTSFMCVLLVFLPSVAPFGCLSSALQFLFRWGDGLAFQPRNCRTLAECYPEWYYQRPYDYWPFFERPPSGPSIVFREPPRRPWSPFDAILFPKRDNFPATTMGAITDRMPETTTINTMHRINFADFATAKPEVDNTFKETSKSPSKPVLPGDQSTTKPPPRHTPPPPIVRPKPPKETQNPSVNNVVEDIPPKIYTRPPPIAQPTTSRPPSTTAAYLRTPAPYAAPVASAPYPAKKPHLISWEPESRYPGTTRRPTPRQRTTRAPAMRPTEQDIRANVPTDNSNIFIERWTSNHRYTTPRPIYDQPD